MKRATLTETKNNLSALVDQVRHGETVLILDRGRPVARLESVIDSDREPSGRAERLERQGVLRRPRTELPADFLHDPPPRPETGASILEALSEERAQAR
jgi:prevent-host-death family protein